MDKAIRDHLQSGATSINYYQVATEEPEGTGTHKAMPSAAQHDAFEALLRSILPEFNMKIEYVLEKFPAQYGLKPKDQLNMLPCE